MNLPKEIEDSDRLGRLFDASNTNSPLLALDWLCGPGAVQICRVSPSGQIFTARNVINWAIQNSSSAQLSQAHLEALKLALTDLPPSVDQALPKDRLLVVRGSCTNQPFEFIYDRANVPKEVERLFQLAGAYLEWVIPKIDVKPKIHTSYNSGSGGQSLVEAFHISSSNQVAVSSGGNGVHIWNLANGTAKPLTFLKGLPKADFHGLWNPATISPDGKTVVYATIYATYAIDWQTERILWETNALVDLSNDHCITKKVAIGGDKGQFLFVAGHRRIEKWDLATGMHLTILATNQPAVQFFETTSDGRFLIVGSNDDPNGNCITASTSVEVWKVNEEKPSAQIVTGRHTGLGLSPDGQTVALSVWGNKNVLLWDWQTGVTNEVPLRTPYGSFPHAIEMFWSPDGQRVAAHVSGVSKPEIIIYDGTTWKPLVRWGCGASKYRFGNDGAFYQAEGFDLFCVDSKELKELK